MSDSEAMDITDVFETMKSPWKGGPPPPGIDPELIEYIKNNPNRTIDITNKHDHKTPRDVSYGGWEWMKFYWRNIPLLIPGEPTIIQAEHPITDRNALHHPWVLALGEVVHFANHFLDNNIYDLPEENDSNIPAKDEKTWLYHHRLKNNIPNPSEDLTIEEEVKYSQYLQHCRRNMSFRLWQYQRLNFEILIDWDFNDSSIKNPANTCPVVYKSNLRFLLEVYEILGCKRELLDIHFVFKDARVGAKRWHHYPETKRLVPVSLDMESLMQGFVSDMLGKWDAYKVGQRNRGMEAGVVMLNLSRGATQRINGLWKRFHFDRGVLKYWFYDAFGVEVGERERDEDVKFWLSMRDGT